jgi:phosphatidylserine decarboxylase
MMLSSAILPVPVAGISSEASTGQHCMPANGGTHHPVVQQLVNLVNTDPVFRADMEAALLEQEPSSYWHGKTLDDMYTFLDEWVVFLPTIDTARLYMDRFYEFADSGRGQQLAAHEPLRGWLYQFMLAVEQFNDSVASAAAVPSWMSDPRINMTDYVVPPGGYQSFNEFFVRQIKPGVRPIDAPDNPVILTSPADSSLMNIADRLTSITTIGVKGENLNIREMLGNDPLSDNFINGRAVLCMLNTTDYHHFHAPVAGQIVSQRQLGGLYYGMDGGWIEYFFQHRRGYMIFDTARFGHVAMVCVGMFTISSVNFTTSTGANVKKGDELGNFAYGGSAVILLFEPGRVSFTVPLSGPPRHVNMGNALATAVQPIQTATAGTNLGDVTFTSNAGSIQGLSTTNASQVGCMPSNYYFPYGLFSYSVINLRPGQSVKVTAKFPNPLPLASKYVKCSNNALTDCSSFTTRINEYTLQLNLTDGGQGDADGIANGTIIDPGGPASPISNTPQSSSPVIPMTTPQAPVSLSNIAVKSASLSTTKVTPGEYVTVTANVANTGTGNGASVIKVYVNGAEEAQQGVSVNSGGSTQVTFDVSRDEPGTYTVYVGGTRAGSFTVDQFTPNTILVISGVLVFFVLVSGVVYMTRKRS